MNALQIQLPMIFEADDYHEFSSHKNTLNNVFKNPDNPKKDAINYTELSTEGRLYRAIFFDVRDPNAKNPLAMVLQYIQGQYAKEKEVIQFLEECFDSDEIDAEHIKNWCSIEGNLRVKKSTKK